MEKPDPETVTCWGCATWAVLIFAVVSLSLLWLAIVLAKAVVHAL